MKDSLLSSTCILRLILQIFLGNLTYHHYKKQRIILYEQQNQNNNQMNSEGKGRI